MKRADMVRYGTEQLFNAENAIELALCQSATLISELSRMRMEARLSAVVGQDALDSAADVILKLTEARRAIVQTHGHLNDVKVQIGCGAVAAGDVEKPPKPTSAGMLQPLAVAAE
ncbi:hypothetical protein [Asticcacaulis sp. AC402]|uniref:hypothetical protein n=1 Tax=Asticcacaulis sp. AC402 TaxID=1282361 RepID=UPI0004CFDF1C|nr:hypothetical protein [Asticcacaulis sp. AC402]